MVYLREDFQKKSRPKTLMKTMPEPSDFDHFGLGRVGEYFTNLLIKTYGGNIEKVKTFWAFPFQVKTHGSFDVQV